jgi:hypothetical protein
MYHTHMNSGQRAASHPVWDDTLILCKDKGYISSQTDDIRGVTCPKCSEIWAKQQPDFARVRLERMAGEDACSWARSTYAVFIDGINYGYVAIEYGKRAKWHRVGHDKVAFSDWRQHSNGREYEIKLAGFKSKEHAALGMIELIGGRAISRDEYNATNAANKARYFANIEKDRNSVKAEMDRLNMAVKTLENIVCLGTNFTDAEIDAFELAISSLKNDAGLEKDSFDRLERAMGEA